MSTDQIMMEKDKLNNNSLQSYELSLDKNETDWSVKSKGGKQCAAASEADTADLQQELLHRMALTTPETTSSEKIPDSDPCAAKAASRETGPIKKRSLNCSTPSMSRVTNASIPPNSHETNVPVSQSNGTSKADAVSSIIPLKKRPLLWTPPSPSIRDPLDEPPVLVFGLPRTRTRNASALKPSNSVKVGIAATRAARASKNSVQLSSKTKFTHGKVAANVVACQKRVRLLRRVAAKLPKDSNKIPPANAVGSTKKQDDTECDNTANDSSEWTANDQSAVTRRYYKLIGVAKTKSRTSSKSMSSQTNSTASVSMANMTASPTSKPPITSASTSDIVSGVNPIAASIRKPASKSWSKPILGFTNEADLAKFVYSVAMERKRAAAASATASSNDASGKKVSDAFGAASSKDISAGDFYVTTQPFTSTCAGAEHTEANLSDAAAYSDSGDSDEEPIALSSAKSQSDPSSYRYHLPDNFTYPVNDNHKKSSTPVSLPRRSLRNSKRSCSPGLPTPPAKRRSITKNIIPAEFLHYHQNMARDFPLTESRTPKEQLDREKNTTAARFSRAKSRMTVAENVKLVRKLDAIYSRAHQSEARLLVYANLLNNTMGLAPIKYTSLCDEIKNISESGRNIEKKRISKKKV